MATYPIEPDKLLTTADVLAPPSVGPGRPSYTSHRRATSTAYYALFHAITGRVVDAVFTGESEDFKQRVSRWVAHRDVAEVCRWVIAVRGTRQYPVPRAIRSLLAPAAGPSHIGPDTVAIAAAFLELYERRLEADYDHEAVFTRWETRRHLALARQAVSLVESAHSRAVQTFFGLIAMSARPQFR